MANEPLSEAGLTLGDLSFIVNLFILCRPTQQRQSAHEWALELVSGAEIECNLEVCRTRSIPGISRGLPWAPSSESLRCYLSVYLALGPLRIADIAHREPESSGSISGDGWSPQERPPHGKGAFSLVDAKHSGPCKYGRRKN